MGVQRKGITLRRRTAGGVLYARFSIAGVQHERSTGQRDYRPAWPEAERIQAAEVLKSANQRKRKRVRAGERYSTKTLEELVARWLLSLEHTHAANTRRTWELYAGTHWIPFFEGVHNLTRERVAEYMRTRLTKVVAETVKHELTALRSFLNWSVAAGEIPAPDGVQPDDEGAGAMLVPSLPKRATGTPHPEKRRAPAVPLDPEHVAAFLLALPAWSASKKVEQFAIQARFIVAYETSLRPSTLDRLEKPKHYRKGETVIRLTADADKIRWKRDVPLSERAREALDAVIDELDSRARAAARADEREDWATVEHVGPIFGAHDYSTHVERAAQVLPAEVRDRFCGAHLRSAALTHWIDDGVTLTAAQWMAGQKRVSTTARYVKSSFRAAREAIEKRDDGDA